MVKTILTKKNKVGRISLPNSKTLHHWNKRENPQKQTCINIPDLFWQDAKQFNGGKLVFSTNGAGPIERVKEPTCQWRKCKSWGFNPWVRKIPWSRKQWSTPVFSPGKSQGQRSLVGYSPWGHKDSDTTEHKASMRIQTYTNSNPTPVPYAEIN